jgi:hypothetical protein
MLTVISALLLAGCDLEIATGSQLATLTTAEQRAAHRFQVSVHDAVLSIQLQSEGGVLRSREIPATGACEDDARVAAVVLSAWMAQPAPKPAPRPPPLPPQMKPALPRHAAPPPVVPVSPAELEPVPAAPAVLQQEDADLAEAPSVSRPPPLNRRWTWSASLEVGAILNGGGAPVMTLRAEGGGRFGVVAEVTAATERAQEAGASTIHWAREFASIGARVRWVPEKRWLIDASLSLAGGWVFARGPGLSGALASGVLDGGACVGMVVGGYELGPFGMFFSARVCGWPSAPRVAGDGTGPDQLPLFDGLMGVGVMWGGRSG